MNPAEGAQAPPEVLSSEIEAALRLLAGKLHALMHEPGSTAPLPLRGTPSCSTWKSAKYGCLR